jgi:hypothetical protein
MDATTLNQQGDSKRFETARVAFVLVIVLGMRASVQLSIAVLSFPAPSAYWVTEGPQAVCIESRHYSVVSL